MTKILIPTFFSNYGGSVFILLKTREILKKEYNVTLKAPLKEADIQNISISPTIKKKEQIRLLFKFLKHFFRELFWIKKEKFDIIYVHDYPSFYIYGLIAKFLKIKVVWHVHDGNIKKIERKRNFVLSTKRIYVAKFQIRHFDKNYCYIPNYVENFHLDKTINKVENIVMLGSICDRKNQEFAIKVVKKLKKKLLLYGTILEKDYFKELEIDNKYIFYKGFKDKKEIFKIADMIFMPSKEESQGLVFLESLANKIPILIPNIEAFKEIADMIGYTKYLYKSNDIDDCIKKYHLLINITDEELNSFQKKIIENFSLENFKNKLLKCFQNV